MYQELEQDEVVKILGILDIVAKGEIQVLRQWIRDRKSLQSKVAVPPVIGPPVQ